jgi:hypothetical protein
MEQILGSSSDDVLAEPVSGGRALSTEERRNVDLSGTIAGWGSDLDPARRPGVPRDKAPELGPESLYPPIEPQSPSFRIHKSTEHAKLTPVFGTSCPPRGLSGALRSIGYRFSEGRLARWLTLMAADRIDVVEGLVQDLAKLHVPNIPKEMGLKSELAYNRPAFVRRVAITGACVMLACVAYSRLKRRRR